MATMNISLPDAMKDWVESQVATGRYANSSDVVRDLVRREQERDEARAQLDAMVEGALASGIGSSSRQELLEKTMARVEEAIKGRKSA